MKLKTKMIKKRNHRKWLFHRDDKKARRLAVLFAAIQRVREGVCEPTARR